MRDLLKNTSIHMPATSSKTWSAGRSPNLSIMKGIAPTFVSSFCCSHKFGNTRRTVDTGMDGTTLCGISNALPVAQIMHRINTTNAVPPGFVVQRFLFILAISPSSFELLLLPSPNGMRFINNVQRLELGSLALSFELITPKSVLCYVVV